MNILKILLGSLCLVSALLKFFYMIKNKGKINYWFDIVMLILMEIIIIWG